MFKLSKKKGSASSVAIDIGTQYVKIVELVKNNQIQKVKNYKILNLVSDGKRFLSKEISRLIKKSFSEMNIDAKVVKTTVSGKSLVVRHVDLPKMSEKELKSSLRYQADLHIPFSLDEAFFDAYIINNNTGLPENRMRVIIVAIKRKDADETIKTIKRAGCSLDLVTVDSIALFNAFENGITDTEKNDTIALVDIGASKTNINVVNNGVSLLCREIKYGGIKFTELLMESLEISFDEAEEKKIAGDDTIIPYISETFKPLIRDIRASFDYFEGLMGGSIQKVYLSGGGSLTRGIVDLFKEKLGIHVLLWNPLRKIDDSELMDKDKEFLISHSSFLSVCMGIAETSS
ncbi:MAG: type IV pilus assembly protein PilM [Candidatus Aureabacteria bacterium]|nr:type IV pilus assembly protein PilM [Candidatus Auribacterota bacterium]